MAFSCVTGFLHSKSVIREWQALQKLGGVTVVCLKLENLSGKVIAHACSSKQCTGSFNCQSCTTSILVSPVQSDHSPRIIPEVYLGIGWKSSAQNHINYSPVWIERLRQENCTTQNYCASSSILLVTVVLMGLVLCRHTCMGDSARNSHYQLVSTVHPHHLQSIYIYIFFFFLIEDPPLSSSKEILCCGYLTCQRCIYIKSYFMRDILKPMKLSLILRKTGKAVWYKEAFATQILGSGNQDSDL